MSETSRHPYGHIRYLPQPVMEVYLLSVEEAANLIGRVEKLERKFLLAREFADSAGECQALGDCLEEIGGMKAALEFPLVQTKRTASPPLEPRPS